MQDFDPVLLKDIRNLMIVVSTHGEGEPPVQAESFYDFLHGPEAPERMDTRYAVCGLGDSSYRFYCQTGKDIDKRLEEMGGKRLMEMESCDIDFEETAIKWVKKVVEVFEPYLHRVKKPGSGPFSFSLNQDNKAGAYTARILEKKQLTGKRATRKVLHVSLDLKNSGLEYEPGDTLAVYGSNSRLYVDELIFVLGFDRTFPVKTKGKVRMLKDVLVHDYDLTLITPLMIRKYAKVTGDNILSEWLADEERVQEYAERHDIIDLVTDFPAPLEVIPFLSVLRKLNPRKYSVASSRKFSGEKADITVRVIENEGDGRTRYGVVSSLLWERLDKGDTVPVNLEPIPRFRLPEDPAKPVIMIGAGTGIAPFRGFLQERKATGSEGKNFLYEDELRTFLDENCLDKLSTAFSRDQDEPVYVSHRLEEEGEEVMHWLDEGALIYVCGSKSGMAVSVRRSMLTILKKHGNGDPGGAKDQFERLRKEGRYVEEVY